MAIFQELHRAGRTILLVTHDPALAARCGRVARLEGGRIVSDERTGLAAADGGTP
jgi:putative ABC transport system ATP-binding protein